MSINIESVDGWPFESMDEDFRQRRDTWREVTEEHYYYALEVLPPMDWTRGSFLIREAHSHEPDGVGVYAAFVRIGNRYFARNVRRDQFRQRLAELVVAA